MPGSSTTRVPAWTRRTGPTAVRADSRTTRSACGRANAFCAAARRARAVTGIRTSRTSTGTRSWRPATMPCARDATRTIGTRLTAHTRHRADSAGSSCVECHMPRTVISIKATMRDHTMSVPAPENTVAFGIPNACTECHADKKAAWAVDVLDTWWPHGRRTKLVKRAEAFTAARANRPEALDRFGRDRRRRQPWARWSGRMRLAISGTTPTRAPAAPCSAPRSRAPGDPRRGDLEPRTARRAKRFRQAAAVLAALDDPQRAVRIAALVSLINLGGSPLAPGDLERFRRVGREFARMERLYRDDAGFERDLGVVHLLGGELERAADALQIASASSPVGRRPGSCSRSRASDSAGSTRPARCSCRCRHRIPITAARRSA